NAYSDACRNRQPGLHSCSRRKVAVPGVTAAVSPQALPKFNPLKQAASAIPNRLFTSRSREKQEPRTNDDGCCWAKMCRKQMPRSLNAYDLSEPRKVRYDQD